MSNFPEIPPDGEYKVNPDKMFIPVSKAWAMVIAIVGCAVWAAYQWWGVKQELMEIHRSLESLGSNRWTAEHQREFAHELRAENPTLKVPSTDEIRRVFSTK